MSPQFCTEPGELRVEKYPMLEPGPHEVIGEIRLVGVCGSDDSR
jgi:D-arabinose 1-dehydrogenase-like Zn-dependent alcohol dehydrogenase